MSVTKKSNREWDRVRAVRWAVRWAASDREAGRALTYTCRRRNQPAVQRAEQTRSKRSCWPPAETPGGREGARPRDQRDTRSQGQQRETSERKRRVLLLTERGFGVILSLNRSHFGPSGAHVAVSGDMFGCHDCGAEEQRLVVLAPAGRDQKQHLDTPR